jgi:hypothetical protein
MNYRMMSQARRPAGVLSGNYLTQTTRRQAPR